MRHKKLAIVLMAMLLTLATVLGAQAATFVLAGDYLQVGISNSGGLINDVGGGAYNAPGAIGLKYAPAGNGIYSAVDFLTPGSPFEFYSIGVNNVNLGAAGYLLGNPFGMVTSDVSAGTIRSAASYSFGGASTLLLIQTAFFDKTSKNINFSIEIENMGPATLTNIVYARGLDPDPDINKGGGFATNNSIAGGVVTAVGPLTNYSIAITSTGSIVGVPSIDRFWDTNPYNLLTAPRNDGNGDWTINMAWDVGTLEPGHSAQVDFQYNVNAPVPVPPSVLLLGSGLLGLVGLGWRRSRKET